MPVVGGGLDEGDVGVGPRIARLVIGTPGVLVASRVVLMAPRVEVAILQDINLAGVAATPYRRVERVIEFAAP